MKRLYSLLERIVEALEGCASAQASNPPPAASEFGLQLPQNVSYSGMKEPGTWYCNPVALSNFDNVGVATPACRALNSLDAVRILAKLTPDEIRQYIILAQKARQSTRQS
jgi:hypothetical protein